MAEEPSELEKKITEWGERREAETYAITDVGGYYLRQFFLFTWQNKWWVACLILFWVLAETLIEGVYR